MSAQKRILIVEDEHDLLSTLDYNLKKEGFETILAPRGEAALEAIRRQSTIDLVLLDVMLPDISGIEICRQLRATQETKGVPIILITARGEEIDRVVGFEVGADDYVVKPFSVRELILRIRAILRRCESDTQEGPTVLASFGRLRVAKDAHQVWVDEEEVVLTALEFKLLTVFLDRVGRALGRDALLSAAWGIHAEVTTRTVDTHVKRLREKLGPAGRYIETIRGIGYRLRAEPSDEP